MTRPALMLPKPFRFESRTYLHFVRQHPCVVSKCWNKVEASHIVFDGQGKVGSKVDDTQAVPMCRKHHSQYHAVGRDQFERFHGLNFAQIIISMLTAYLADLEVR